MKTLKSIIYRIIYQSQVNYILRNINKLFYPWLTNIRLHPSGKVNIRTNSGQSINLFTNQTDFVAFCVFWDGLYSYEYLDIFEKVISKCEGFIDVGANAGLFSLLAATSNSRVKVIAIDPSLATSYYVPKNIAANDFKERIQFYNIALSDAAQEMTFFEVKNPKYTYLTYNLGGASSLYEKPEAHQERTVPVETLDSLVKENQNFTDQIDFVKIDAEGAEPQIIRGMSDTIAEHKPIIVCEILFGLIESELEDVFSGHGYDFYFHTNKGLARMESIKRASDDGVRNCFFVHPDKKWMIEEFIIDVK